MPRADDEPATERSLGRVVIVGHSGFVGGRLHEALGARGHDVVGYSSRELDLRAAGASERLASALDETTTLVVAAALTPPGGATLDGFADNVAMLQSVAHALELVRPKSCVYMSSDGVYGFEVEHVDERTPVAPSGWYPVAKYTGERILQTSADAQDIALLIIRPSAIFGPGDTHRAYGPNRFARSIVEERIVRLFGQGEEIRDHVFIDDVVEATIGLAEKGATGVFNVASGAARTFSSIVDDLRAVAPVPFDVVHEPRQTPVVHRRHDVSRLLAILPDLRMTPFEEALALTLARASS